MHRLCPIFSRVINELQPTLTGRWRRRAETFAFPARSNLYAGKTSLQLKVPSCEYM